MWRVTQAFDLAGINHTGVPILRALREGWEWICSHNGTNTCRIGSISIRPCKEREDGAPTVVFLGEETRTEGWYVSGAFG